MDEELMKLRSVVDKCKQSKFVAEEKAESLHSLESGIQARLYKLKLDYSQFKIFLREEWYTKFILSDLQAAQDTNDCLLKPTEGETEDDVADTLYDVKDKLENSKENVEEHAEQIELLLNEYKGCLSELEDSIAELDSKRRKLSELSKKSLEELTNGVTEEIKHISDKESQLRHTIAEVEVVTADVHTELTELRKLEEFTRRNVKELEILHWSHNGADRLVRWCDWCISSLQSLNGVRDVGFSNNQWKVAIFGSPGSENSRELQVAMSLSLAGLHDVILTDVQVDCTDIDASAIVKEAIANNDIPGLLANLRDMWLQNFSLILEIESLRERYIIDWKPDSHMFYVMFTKSTNALCTLRVSEGYPRSGSVVLDKVKSQGKEADLNDYQPTPENRSLTDWLCYLKQRLEPESRE